MNLEWVWKTLIVIIHVFIQHIFTRLLFCAKIVFDVGDKMGIENKYSPWQHEAGKLRDFYTKSSSGLCTAHLILLYPNCGAYYHHTVTN